MLMFVRYMTMVVVCFAAADMWRLKWTLNGRSDQLNWTNSDGTNRNEICTHKPTSLRNLGVTTWFILREHANVVTQLGITTWLIMCAYTNIITQLGVNTWKKILNYTGTERLRSQLH